MTPLPPLTEFIDKGAAGGLEFERLMHQLLLRHADHYRFRYEPRGGAGGDAGIDGFAPQGGVEGVRTEPVGFQFKWLWEDIHKGEKARQIKAWLDSAERHEDIRNWVFVTPWDLKEKEREWLHDLPSREDTRIYHWGRERVESLLRDVPALYARYYPQEARQREALGLGDFDGVDFREFSRRYREKVALVYRDIRTLGLPPETLREGDAGRSIRLRDIFVPLSFLPERDHYRSESLAEVVRSKRSLVALGDPGSGKSTLLTFLALLHAGAAELQGYVPASDAVPLLIPLRDFTRLQRERHDLSFLDYLEVRARTDYSLERAHRAFFESALRMGEAVVLLDGLDEVGNAASRRRISNAVRAFRASYPNCPFWVTSRIYGYVGDARLPSEEFSPTLVGRLDDEQIGNFIDRWYSHHPIRREGEERAASLRNAIQRTPSVKRLASNPLLLTLMAFIHQGLRRLPQDRGELYEKCIEMLLKTWQEAKWEEGRAPAHPFEKVGFFNYVNTQKTYLSYLAMFIQERRSKNASEDERGLVSRTDALACLVENHLAIARRTSPQLSEDQARTEMEHFLDYVSDRTGLLVDRGGDQLSFIHLSFQEYLAAWAVTCQERGLGAWFFLRHLGDQAWQEVLLLRLYIILRVPGGGGPRRFDRVVRTLTRWLRWCDWWRRRCDIYFFGTSAEWLTLARALRDNLDFTPDTEELILRRAIDHWIRDPPFLVKGRHHPIVVEDENRGPTFSGRWFNTIEEICLFSTCSRQRLKSLLKESLSQAQAREAAACLHLLAKLFGLPEDVARTLRRRSDLQQMLPDLAIYSSNAPLSALIRASSTTASWHAALRAGDSPELYALSLEWASQATTVASAAGPAGALGALALLWGKVLADLRSRAGLIRLKRPKYIFTFNDFWSIRAAAGLFDGSLYSTEMPLNGGRCCIDSLELPSLKRGSEDFAELLWPGIAFEWRRDSKVWTSLIEPLSCWARSLVAQGLGQFEPHVDLQAYVAPLASSFADYAVRDFAPAFSREIVREFATSSTGSHSYGFAKKLASVFSESSPSDLIGNHVRDTCRPVILRSSSTFSRSVVRVFTSGFCEEFAQDPLGPIGKVSIEKLLAHPAVFVIRLSSYVDFYFQCHSSLEIDKNFVEPLAAAHGLDLRKEELFDRREDIFAMEQGMIADERFWTLILSLAGVSARPEARRVIGGLNLNNPYAMPLALIGLLATAVGSHVYTLGRYLATSFPDGDPPDDAMETWLRRNPISVYAAAFAWEEHAKIYQSTQRRLEGPHGALMIAHAAYAALMTGLYCNGPVWTALLEDRDINDPMIEISYTFHELCHFRGSEANARKLSELLAVSSGKCREVLNVAGIGVAGEFA